MELKNIIDDIKNNPCITEKELANKYFCHERSIRRYIKVLKDNNIIKISGSGIKKKWIIIRNYMI